MKLIDALIELRQNKARTNESFFVGAFEAAQLCGKISPNKAAIIQMFFNCGRLQEALEMLENALTQVETTT